MEVFKSLETQDSAFLVQPPMKHRPNSTLRALIWIHGDWPQSIADESGL
jgi:hypothetical protein